MSFNPAESLGFSASSVNRETRPMSLIVGNNKVISIHYTLTDSNGELIDTTKGGKALAYLHGAGKIIPGLESALAGKSVGDNAKITVDPKEAYGMRVPELVKTVPRSMFDGVDDIKAGKQFQAESDSGGLQLITVLDIQGDDITIDTNHPLAGKTLTFDVEIENIREATQDEAGNAPLH